MTLAPILTVENFSKSFTLHEQGKIIPSSSHVNFEVFEGKLTALIGPTGAGKSTVLKGIYRTYLATTGNITYRCKNGKTVDIASADEHTILNLRKMDIGFVTQFLHALPRQSAEDIVAMPLYVHGVCRQQAKQQARETLSSLNLPERLWSLSPATFSGGEKQRVNLARGLLANPRLLLLDEPTASLDPATTECVIDIINALKNNGTAIVAIFHDLDIVKRLGDDLVSITPPVFR